MAVIILFVAQWQLSVFCQSFFLHRYGAHKQFTMSRGWERVFHVFTYVTQNASYLNPRGYAILHRMHHAYSDTPKDPHTPTGYRAIVPGLFKMMWRTKNIYQGYADGTVQPEARFDGNTPSWPMLEKVGGSWPARIAWAGLFGLYFWRFATAPWQWALLPGCLIMGAMHGAIVNWAGHRYGYRNFAISDASRNTLPIDFLTAGELCQNNHHKFAMSPNFAVRWFELDTTYQVARVLGWIGVIDLHGAQVGRWQPDAALQPGE